MRNQNNQAISRLDEKRRAAGLTIAELARLAAVPYERVWKACSGGLRLAAEEIARLETALGQTERQQ